MSEPTGAQLDDLDQLSTEELRERAFALAHSRHDRHFFWDLIRHLPHAQESNLLDDSTGSIGEFLDEVIGMWREFTGHEQYGEAEPLMRARFIDYLTSRS
ncbi:MAG TPA: hypothetical protein VGN37_10710 [Actinocatenispora sp.]